VASDGELSASSPMPNNDPDRPDADTPRPASFAQVAAAVFWSFFGIRKKAAGERDAMSIKPLHVIIAGLLGAAILVALMLTLVHFIVHSA
jgi:hypothetical protein